MKTANPFKNVRYLPQRQLRCNGKKQTKNRAIYTCNLIITVQNLALIGTQNFL